MSEDQGAQCMQIEIEAFTPDSSDLSDVIQGARRIQSALSDKPDWFDYYVLNHSQRIAFDLKMVDGLVRKDDRILEFGCSPLLLTAALHARGYDVSGVDVEPERFGGAIRELGLNVIACDIETQKLPVKDEEFDVAIFNEVFEHLRIDLIETFREIRRVIRPGGYLLLSTPNGRSYGNIRGLMLGDVTTDSGIYESYEALRTVGHMGHVREYTVTEVRRFLERMGFECERTIFRGRYASNLGQAFVRLFPKLRPHFTLIARRTDRAE